MFGSFKLKASLLATALLVSGVGMAQRPTPPAARKAAAVATPPVEIKLIEQYVPKGGEIGIPYKKYELPNGLTLIIHEDKSNPIVHVDVTYHVGSAREEVGKSGFAHFFEHMMFQGSDNVADEEHFKIVSGAGGTMNGSTNKDRTNYFETVPKNYLETALWLEADRMGFLLDAVTQQKFEVQRSTVKNERGQRYDNVPYGISNEVMGRNLYPFGHPYSWSTIGYVADLDRVNVQDLKNFFLRWYGPNNATLTIGGDVKEAEVLNLVGKYFGSIPRGPEVKNAAPQIAKLDKDRYVSYEDNFARLPRLYLTLPTVQAHHPDETAIDAMCEKLGGGANSILYKNLVKTGLARNAVAYHPTSELSGEIMIMVDPFPGKKPADLLAIVRQSIEELGKTGVNDDDITRFKSSREVQFLSQLSTVSDKVSILAANQTLSNGNPKQFIQDQKYVADITKDKVMSAFRKYLENKPAVILTVVPKGKTDMVANTDNYTVVETPVKPSKEYDGLTYNKAKDNFKRSVKPKVGPTPIVTIPAFSKSVLTNGITVNGIQSDEQPMTYVFANFKGGRALESNMLSKAGIMTLTANLLEESTKKYSTEAFANELEKLGASINVSVANEDVTVYIATPTKNVVQTMRLAEERLLNPAFNEEDFKRLKEQTLEGIKNASEQPTAIAGKVANRLMYGPKNILGIPASGTEESVGALTIDDVKSCYNQMFPAKDAFMVVASDKSLPFLLPQLQLFTRFRPIATLAPKLAAALPISKTTIYLVNKDKAPQSEIRVGTVGLPYDATGDYYKAGIFNYALGGSFNSRINLLLREKHGFTYGARSGFNGGSTFGVFNASAGVRGNATDSSVVDFMTEISNFRKNGINEEELAYTKKAIGQAEALKYESAEEKLGFLATMLRYNLAPSFTADQNKVLTELTKADVDALAKKLLTDDKMNIVVVGDAAKNLPLLQKLGYPVVELDKFGAPVTGK
jgi:zinc protease